MGLLAWWKRRQERKAAGRGNPTARSACDEGVHDFGKWKVYLWEWQRRECDLCGFVEEKEI